MSIRAKDFRVPPGKRVDLHDWPTKGKALCASDSVWQAEMAALVARLSQLQELFYAANRHALLLIFQAMDAAGKDSTIKHVMSGVNPQGCQVFSFKHPTPLELQHDFLWRSSRDLPERGRIGIFNRSYYEEVLIVRVHPRILRSEGLEAASHDPEIIWPDRYRSIVDMERHLHENGTRILKFFLHLSKEEQRKRFLDRLDQPDKNWKVSQNDITERGFWDDYQKAYAACLSHTSTRHAPWHVIPADDKANAHLIIASLVVERLERLKLTPPPQTSARRQELDKIRTQLQA